VVRVVEVGGGAGIGREHLHAVAAHRPRSLQHVEQGVLLVQLAQREPAGADAHRGDVHRPHHLGPAVEHGAVAVAADHGAEDAERRLEARRERLICRIHQRVGAGLELGDRGMRAGRVVGVGPAGGDDLDRVTGVPQRLCMAAEQRHRLPGQRGAPLAVGLEHDVSLVAHHAGELEPRQLGDAAGERERVADRADAAAPHPHVDVDQRAGARVRGLERARERRGGVGVVERDDDRDGGRRLGHDAQLVVRHDLVGQEDLADPGTREGARLPHRRGGDPDRARRDLQLGDLQALVRLEVRPQGDRAVGPGGHRRHVALEPLGVDQQRRRRQRAHRTPRRGSRHPIAEPGSGRVTAISMRSRSVRSHAR
jgi:hypothetical protein